jgi:glutamyl-tRNA synthetase
MATLAVTRFAPSPTGLLHLGNARTALFSWLYARHQGGRFVVRIEDTDTDRSRREHVTALLEDLAWLGLDYDAGPGRDDGLGPYFQSERAPLYAAAFARLEADGRAYPCYCTELELEVARATQKSRGEPPRYPGTCRRLDAAGRARRAAEGRAVPLRFAVPAGITIAYEDLVRGAQSFHSDALGDFVIRRADGTASFLTSNALDDARMRITHVLRGEDHVANTPLQLMLLDALGEQAPQYGHLPLLVGHDGAPLAKRRGAQSVAGLRAEGYLAQAVLNLLYRLGHSAAVEGWLERDTMIGAFRPDHLGRAPARLDAAQLTHWQKEAVRHAPAEALAAWLPAIVPPAARMAFLAAVRANLVLPGDALPLAEIVYGVLGRPEGAIRQAIAAAGEATYVAALAALDAGGDWQAITRAVREATGRKGRELYQPLRAALTHALEGPELGPLLALMPVAVPRLRLAQARELCSLASTA